MKGLGGFFELELPTGGEPYHPTAQALSSGRACFSALLDERKPRAVRVPFYTCDALLAPLRERGIPFTFYGLDEQLVPQEPSAPKEEELTVLVDYFGLKSRAVLAHWARAPESVVLDLVQSFYLRPPPGVRGFNSARKWLGVPDGAYLFGAHAVSLPEAENVSLDHLVNRLLGRQDLAFRQFQENEARVSPVARAMSSVSARLLGSIDYEACAARRTANFDCYARVLGPSNELGLVRDADAIPFCYPYLPPRPLAHADFHREGVFVPRFWPEVVSRAGAPFPLERRLARDLLPLPVDHRLGSDDCDRVIGTVRRLLGE